MSEITGQSGLRGTATAVVHESYAFACMRCGHGWEQSYEIEHHTDADGHEFVQYVTDGRIVPSPLSRPACQNCDGHVVRIMRAGQVASVRGAAERDRHSGPPAGPVEVSAVPDEQGAGGDDGEAKGHHWHLSDLLHPFHRKAS
ncbi:hypothetical protein AQI88_21755 [Streptomyces cellostaticus]|uniref:C2H2-type domain-containing protein n=1 Tax=Streptomyces cellostaticus TaxID=67285 RepID=A0A117PVL4_9ACTN|nr:hypothetical protein [Streptomyces cellostaticus]KUM94338.1 hypothetical protein AQI88_21755 [Streptomyces cellostaticus]GHI07075.1 hypothetical protein Scel_53960 [Streptomyces cellostaticus]